MPSPASAQLTVDTTRTTTSTSTKSAPARKGPRVRTTPSVIQLAASQWNAMNGDQKNSYAALTAQMTTQLEPAIPPHKTAYSTFVALASASYAAGQAQPAIAMPYAPAPILPAVQVSAAFTGGLLTVTLVPAAPYAHPIAIKAARPMLAANDIYKSAAFKKIGSLPSLSGPTDITALYQTRFRVPGTGYKIVLELMGVAPGGYHTSALMVVAVVAGASAEAALAAPDAQESAAVSLRQVG